MIYALIIAFTLFSPFFLWVYYLAVMALKRVRNESGITGLSIYLGGLTLVIGYLLDAYVNVLVLSIVMLELPQETTVTARLRRHYRLEDSWRRRVTLWFLPLLEPYDPGHITG